MLSTLTLSLGAVALPATASEPVRQTHDRGPAAIQVVASDMAVPAGIFEHTYTWGSAVADYDVDGWPDFFLGRHGEHPGHLYHNDGDGHFTDVGVGTIPQIDRHGCAWGDINKDGLLDLLCGTGARHGTFVKANELWVQNPDHTFVDRASELGVADPYGRARHVSFIDVNNDGYADILIGNLTGRPDGILSMNRLFLNHQGSSFSDKPEYGLDKEIGAACVQPSDINGDGWQDLLLCPEQSNNRKLGLRLYLNHDGTGFTEVAQAYGLGEDQGPAQLADLNGDGSPDLVQVVGHRELKVWLQKSGKFVLSFSRPLTNGNNVATGDVNGDGHPDIYVLQGLNNTPNTPDLMLLNNGQGTDFTEMSIPETSDGKAESVAAIDYDRNGLSDFIVLNGAENDGPVQLIAFFPDGRSSGHGPGSAPPPSGSGERATPQGAVQRPTGLDGAGTIAAGIKEFPIPSPDSQSYGIVAGPDGSLWFTEFRAKKIGRIDPTGQFTQFRVPDAHRGLSIAAGPDGNLWFTEDIDHAIGRVSPTGDFQTFVIPNCNLHVCKPAGITAGPDGNVWFTDFTAGTVGRITPSGNITEFTVPTAKSEPASIVTGPDGNLWFTERGAHAIGRITPSGTITEFPIANDPYSIAAGSDGALWVTETFASRIARMTTSGVVTQFSIPKSYSSPIIIAAGPDGNLWFTEFEGNRVGQITTSGAFTEFLLPSKDSEPYGIAAGPDGNVWFTEHHGNRIGKISG